MRHYPRLAVSAMSLVLALASVASARVNPLGVITERLVRPEIVIVLDTSGSMAWYPNPATTVGNDCGGNQTGSVDLCGDGLCSGIEGSSKNRCSKDCNISSYSSWAAGSAPACNTRGVKGGSRMFMVKRVLRGLLPDLRESASLGLVTFKQSGYFRYYRGVPGTTRKVTIFLSRSEMAQLGAWNDSASRPRGSFSRSGVTYTLLSGAGLKRTEDSLYARIDDSAKQRRFRFANAGNLYYDGNRSWKHRGSYYTYTQWPMWRYSSITKATYKGPQFVDSRGRVWVYNKFSYHYSSQGISAGSSGLVVQSIAAQDSQAARDAALDSVMARLNLASNGGLWAWGGTPTGPAIESAAEHFVQRKRGTGPFNGVGPDKEASCRPRFVLLLTDGQSNRGTRPWDAARNLYRNSTFKDNPVKTLVVGLPGLPSSAVNELDRTADMGDDGKANNSATALFASDEAALTRVIKQALFDMVRGDYTTTAPGVTTSNNSTVAGNLALVASTEYPGWRGHLRGYDLTRSPHELLWDAGEVMTKADYSKRKIYTGLPSVQSGQPVPLLSTDGKINIRGGCLGCGSAGLRQVWAKFGTPPTDAEIRAVGLWLAGKDKQWKLGPVLRSNPASVGTPPRYEDVPGHATFRKRLAGRERLIYFTSNHGLLHAVRAKDGSEAFAYLPPNLLPKVYNLWRRGGDDADPAKFNWVLASSPRIEDVPPATDLGNWSTMLALTMGPGDRAFVVLDVTRPSSCTLTDCTVNDPPFTVVQHSRNLSTDSYMGQTWSVPTMFYRYPQTSKPSARMAMGSGYGPGGQGNYYMYFQSLTDAPVNARHSPSAALDFAVLADTVAAVNEEKGRAVIATYQADLAGRLVRYQRGDSKNYSNTIIDGGWSNPLYYAPAAYHRGQDTVLLAAVSGSLDEEQPPAGMQATLYLRQETAGTVDGARERLTCKASRICSRAPGCPEELPKSCTAPSRRAMPVGSPLLIRNTLSTQQSQFEAFFLLYDPPTAACGKGSSWLVRMGTQGTRQELISATRYQGIRATGMSLAGGRIDLAISRTGTQGEQASAFTVMRDYIPPARLGTEPYVEGWKEVHGE